MRKSEAWFNRNCLKLDGDKTLKITFSFKNNYIKDHVTLLGLKWKYHVDGMYRKISSQLFILTT